MKRIIIASLLLASFALSLVSCGGGDADETTRTPESAVDTVESEPVDTWQNRTATTEDIVKDGKTVGKKGIDDAGGVVYEEYYDELGRTTERTDYNPDGKVSLFSKYSFLDNGEEPDHYVTEKYSYEDGVFVSKSIIRYNSAGLIESIYEKGSEDVLIEAYLYEYDNEGRKIKESYVNSKNVLTMITESEYTGGKLTKEIYKKGSGTLDSYTEFEYNDNGTMKKESNFDADGNMTSYVEYIYGDDGSFERKDEYVPDDDGNFILF